MKLEERIELLHRSSQRMMEMIPGSRNAFWWGFMRRETWIHLRRSLELWWQIVQGKEK